MTSIAVSLILYLLLIFLLKNVLNGVELFSTAYLPATVLIVVVAWGPPFLTQTLKKIVDPTSEQKLMKNKEIMTTQGVESESSDQVL